jgi:hypothetical protein
MDFYYESRMTEMDQSKIVEVKLIQFKESIYSTLIYV